MTFGATARKPLLWLTLYIAALALFALPRVSFAQELATTEAVAESPADGAEVTAEAPAFDYYGPEMIKGAPHDAGIDIQAQFSPIGQFADGFHVALVWIMGIISVFVLGLLLWVMFRYNRRANTVPSKTSHNTLIEVIWTVIPVLVLVAIAIPSITLLARQYETPPKDALTIKATGYQWYWGYTYADNGGFEIISNMKDEDEAKAAGFPEQLEADNRMVVPVGVPLRIQTFGADVIHSFGIPSLWYKLDAVPGRINEKLLTITEPGIYYGQCMELCGAKHGYMPITIEARPMEDFNRWVKAQGGKTVAEIAAEKAAEAASAAAAAAAPAVEEAAEGAAPEAEDAPATEGAAAAPAA